MTSTARTRVRVVKTLSWSPSRQTMLVALRTRLAQAGQLLSESATIERALRVALTSPAEPPPP